MQAFKLGDWVIPIDPDSIENTVIKFSRSMEIEQESHLDHFAKHFKLWKPKQGEWCWFWNEGMNVPFLQN